MKRKFASIAGNSQFPVDFFGPGTPLKLLNNMHQTPQTQQPQKRSKPRPIVFDGQQPTVQFMSAQQRLSARQVGSGHARFNNSQVFDNDFEELSSPSWPDVNYTQIASPQLITQTSLTSGKYSSLPRRHLEL